MKSITILGATGSIGDSTVDICRQHPHRFTVKAITAHSNVEKLAELARSLEPDLAVIGDETRYSDLKDALSDTNIGVAAGPEALVEAAEQPVDLLISAIVGAAALQPTLAAVKKGTTVALANKECLVCAGDLVMNAAKQSGARVLPVDSEHNAIFQVFDRDRPEGVRRLILTASGGPFRTRAIDTLKSVTPAEAVAHPNWDMGAKISVDSATMMNKGLEVVEAYHLFPVTPEQIDVVIHPQSIVHSMVEYADSSVLAQMGTPDMRTPIAYAMAWPDRITSDVETLNLASIGTLTFESPDFERFPCLALAKAALAEGEGATLALNAANEIAVAAFLDHQIKFLDIPKVVEETVGKRAFKAPQSLETVVAADKAARDSAKAIVERLTV